MSHARPRTGDWVGCKASESRPADVVAELYSLWRDGDALEMIRLVRSSAPAVERELLRRATGDGVNAWWQTEEDGYVVISLPD